MYTTTSTVNLSNSDIAAIAAVGTTAIVITVIISLAVAVISIISMWKIFTKAGKEGWAAIIPIYNIVVLYQIVGINPLYLLILIGTFIPFVNFIALIGILVLNILASIKLAKAFGKSGGFAVGLIFLPVIFQLILAFGNAEYQGVKE